MELVFQGEVHGHSWTGVQKFSSLLFPGAPIHRMEDDLGSQHSAARSLMKVIFSGESGRVRGLLFVVSSACLFTNNRTVIRVSGNIAVTALQISIVNTVPSATVPSAIQAQCYTAQ